MKLMSIKSTVHTIKKITELSTISSLTPRINRLALKEAFTIFADCEGCRPNLRPEASANNYENHTSSHSTDSMYTSYLPSLNFLRACMQE